MPPVTAGGYLVHMLMDMGPGLQGAAGLVSVTYTEIHAWAELTGANLAPWEAQLLKRLSRTYASAVVEGEDPLAPPPYVRSKPDRQEVGKRVSSMFKMLAARGKKS